ncbi:MAG: hypothetical protein LUQ29_14555, partial [Methylococcaceae bacterium]|nr:hypothetical protein [Methylococcaceae bacterium]
MSLSRTDRQLAALLLGCALLAATIVLLILLFLVAGSRYFCESFFGHPCPTSGKNHATANACGC